MKRPLLDLHMFKNSGFSLGIGLTFVTTIGLFSLVFLLPLFLQNLRGFSALHSGLMVLPTVIGSMVSMPIAGRLYDRIGPRFPTVLGLVITGVSSLWLQVLDVTTPDDTLRLILFVRGIGVGFAMMPVMTYALSSVPQRMTAQASALLNVSRTIFASLGIADICHHARYIPEDQPVDDGADHHTGLGHCAADAVAVAGVLYAGGPDAAGGPAGSRQPALPVREFTGQRNGLRDGLRDQLPWWSWSASSRPCSCRSGA